MIVDSELIVASWAAMLFATCVFRCRDGGAATVVGVGSGKKHVLGTVIEDGRGGEIVIGPDWGGLSESNRRRGDRRRRFSPGGGGDDGEDSVGKEGFMGRFLLTDRWEAVVPEPISLTRTT